jgi:hypothetical protein
VQDDAAAAFVYDPESPQKCSTSIELAGVIGSPLAETLTVEEEEGHCLLAAPLVPWSGSGPGGADAEPPPSCEAEATIAAVVRGGAVGGTSPTQYQAQSRGSSAGIPRWKEELDREKADATYNFQQADSPPGVSCSSAPGTPRKVPSKVISLSMGRK